MEEIDKRRNLLVTLQYDGSRYHGFQVQENALSVCEVFQDSVEKVLGRRWEVKGCSRTDTGVHARDYKLSMIVAGGIPCERLLVALNRLLPKDIAVVGVEEVEMGFHARYDCVSKEYTYRIYNGGIKDPFTPTQRYHYRHPIEVVSLGKVAQQLVGTHDFTGFSNRSHLVEDGVRTIVRAEVTRLGEEVQMVLEGDGFLYNMVRVVIGTLLAIAEGKLPPQRIMEILEKKDRRLAGRTAPAHGLYLTKVRYPEGVHGVLFP